MQLLNEQQFASIHGRFATRTSIFLTFGLLLLVAGRTGPASAAMVHAAVSSGTSNGQSGEFYAHTEGSLDLGGGTWTVANSATSGVSDSWLGGFQLGASSSVTANDGALPFYGVWVTGAQASWTNQIWFRTNGVLVGPVTFYFSLSGTATLDHSLPLFRGLYDDAGAVVYAYDNGLLVGMYQELNYMEDGLIQHAQEGVTHFDLNPAFHHFDGHDYWFKADLHLLLASHVTTDSVYSVKADYGHTLGLTYATVNGMSLEEAGIVMEFESERERAAAAVPEPSSLTLLAIGVCTGGIGASRRRRHA